MEESIYNIGVLCYYDHCNNHDKYDRKTKVNFSITSLEVKVVRQLKSIISGCQECVANNDK
jgi:hypothetical protein